jgi:pyruvate/2-oxoglutarate/acetoin dehydrogenase E1 component/TPP-dependent pyruvate/acetoin dehydrogenase alpha subunit
VLSDYRLAAESRQASLLGRKEVLTGKAKFGIFGDGKEVPQIAMAKAFKEGDFRSGYYRDQTFALAAGMTTLKEFFAQLYADTDVTRDPASGGRSMNCHFGTRLLDENGKWKEIVKMKNTSSDISPTGAQMSRLVGLAYASKLYRNDPGLKDNGGFSVNGNEVAFGTIGNASCAEGIFWEAVNAGGVLMIPMAISIWDDGYGISVPGEYQITKNDLSEVLSGFKYDEKTKQGYNIYTVKAWDYAALVRTYEEGIKITREKHIPSIFHITEVTQPQGHSTSGSHERYKSKERLQWEQDYCCVSQMRSWILKNKIAPADVLDEIDKDAKETVRKVQKEAWDEYLTPIKKERDEVLGLFKAITEGSSNNELNEIINKFERSIEVNRKITGSAVMDVLRTSKKSSSPAREKLVEWKKKFKVENEKRYSSHLYSESEESPLKVKEVKPVYSESSPLLDGREVLLTFFDKAFERDPRIFAIGEDVGKLGDVNQGMAGLQAKYGEIRVSDTGIREATIAGQGIGAALRGLKPIIEIQYLDYLLYAMQVLSDDLASLHYRTRGGQKSPCIIRTRGHRLEGIWHSGSPMGTVINTLRGIHVLVPRNMTQAAGFYNTILKGDDPALIIERLNAYRLKEKLPDNIADITVPLGVPEILEEGNDVTIVTYGACVDIARDAIKKLKEAGISCELIDVQSLLPFDIHGLINESLKKTNRILFLDEDVPGGASAYMMQQVIDRQGGYFNLDSQPRCLSAKPHRPAYGTDGDYFSKPNADDIFEEVYDLMNEADPDEYPLFY